jgi:hypothetical protein
MKKIKLSQNAKNVLWAILFISAAFGIECGPFLYRDAKIEKEKIKKKYNSLQVLKYNADTIEFVCHNRGVQYEFRRDWSKYNYGQSIVESPKSDRMSILKYRGDTIQIKFEDAKFQRQFEKQWNKYSKHKLNHINKNVKKR